MEKYIVSAKAEKTAIESLRGSAATYKGGGDTTQEYHKTEENLAIEPAVINNQLNTDRS